MRKGMELLSVSGWKPEQLQMSPCYRSWIQVVYILGKETQSCVSTFPGAIHPDSFLETSVVPA